MYFPVFRGFVHSPSFLRVVRLPSLLACSLWYVISEFQTFLRRPYSLRVIVSIRVGLRRLFFRQAWPTIRPIPRVPKRFLFSRRLLQTTNGPGATFYPLLGGEWVKVRELVLFSIKYLCYEVRLAIGARPYGVGGATIFIRAGVPSNLGRSGRTFLGRVVNFSSSRVRNVNVFTSGQLVFFRGVIHSLYFSLPRSFGRFLVHADVVLRSFLVPSSSSSTRSRAERLLRPPVRLEGRCLPSLR